MRNLYYEQLQKESDGTYEKEIRADERRKILHEQRALDVNLQISAEELRADERKKFAQAVKNFINTYRYGNDDLIAFIEEYMANEGK